MSIEDSLMLPADPSTVHGGPAIGLADPPEKPDAASMVEPGDTPESVLLEIRKLLREAVAYIRSH